MHDKTTTQLRINDTIYRKAKYIAEKELRTANSQIEYFVLKGVEQYEKEHGVIVLGSEE